MFDHDSSFKKLYIGLWLEDENAFKNQEKIIRKQLKHICYKDYENKNIVFFSTKVNFIWDNLNL
jgi:hypothetical protein